MPSARSSAGPRSGGAAELDALEREVIDHLFELQPGYAVFLGLHQYDGRVPDLSTASTERWSAAAHQLLRRLAAVPAPDLSPARRLDATLLRLLLESPLFDFEEGRDFERNPMAYVGPISLSAYMVREYGPAEERAAAMVRTLAAVPRLLEDGWRRLDARLPEPYLRLALAMASGIPAHLEEAEGFVRARAPTEVGGFREVRAGAEAALAAYTARLKDEASPKAVADFALGPEKFQRLLWVREGIETPTAEILAAGQADLARNQARIIQIAQEAHPNASPAESVHETLEAMFRQHPTAEGLLPYARELVAGAKKFVQEHQLVTIPDPSECRVEETPIYGRALSTASMHPPGPFDVAGDEGIYFVTPVDPTWPPDRQEQWLRSLNQTMLRNITFHEVFPGHYLQFLALRKSAGSYVRKVFLSSSFTEGWAHYCEQLTIEAGAAHGHPGAEVAQLHDALLRDCRLIASIGLHTQGWSLAQATTLFEREAHMEALPAEREAIRGTFNPEYFCYTLGKLAILQARQKLLAGRFGGSLRSFHDALLGFGCPPVGVLESLLGGAGG